MSLRFASYAVIVNRPSISEPPYDGDLVAAIIANEISESLGASQRVVLPLDISNPSHRQAVEDELVRSGVSARPIQTPMLFARGAGSRKDTFVRAGAPSVNVLVSIAQAVWGAEERPPDRVLRALALYEHAEKLTRMSDAWAREVESAHERLYQRHDGAAPMRADDSSPLASNLRASGGAPMRHIKDDVAVEALPQMSQEDVQRAGFALTSMGDYVDPTTLSQTISHGPPIGTVVRGMSAPTDVDVEEHNEQLRLLEYVTSVTAGKEGSTASVRDAADDRFTSEEDIARAAREAGMQRSAQTKRFRAMVRARS